MTESQSRQTDHTAHGAHPGANAVPAEFVLGIDHVGVAVADFDAALEWYARVLGMECTHEEINEAQGVREGMLSPPPPCGRRRTVEPGPAADSRAPDPRVDHRQVPRP